MGRLCWIIRVGPMYNYKGLYKGKREEEESEKEM